MIMIMIMIIIMIMREMNNTGPKSSLTLEHEGDVKKLIDDDFQICVEDIFEDLTNNFKGFYISKPQLNHHLKNTMMITVKKPHFDVEVKDSVINLQMWYEWFMDWKNKDLDYTKNYIFDDEVGFHIIIRNN
ncbi:hypothetical protein K501DRAFT_270863 [Backusella circina FSU 941]|nr:hypothetical protein K501DRAFT_270863 [Backusella circina FSU 941]